MSIVSLRLPTSDEDDREPTATELAAIEYEWPLIEAEMALVDAEIRPAGRPLSELDRRRIRRGEKRVQDEARRLAEDMGSAGVA